LPGSIAVADFNHDGKLDLAVANENSDNLSILLGTGVGTFEAAVNYPAGSSPASVAVGDFNRDGKLDLVVADAGSSIGTTISVLPGNGDGTYQTAVGYPAGAEPISVAVADFNSDGKLDLVVADFGVDSGNTVSLLLGNGDGSFQMPTAYTVGTGPGLGSGGNSETQMARPTWRRQTLTATTSVCSSTSASREGCRGLHARPRPGRGRMKMRGIYA
jgi:FG-GAP-like repeat